MEIQVFNTLTKSKEVFKPLVAGKLSMYNCGPTVYNRAHIGNLRAYVLADTIRRTFEYFGYEVNQVVNITDVGHLSGENSGNADEGEDKMTKALRREGMPLTIDAMYKVATKYQDAFFEDMKELNILPANQYPRAADHIQEDIDIISTLEKKGFTYKTSDGIYFDTSKFPQYGKLGNIDISGLRAGARVATNTEKKNPTDFALWKFNPSLGWTSPWGNGFPGWHIECSAMSAKYLGQPFDIHTGGVDHIPVHHNNEIAQSEAAFGKPLANYWLHNEFVNMGGSKMAKSSGGFITLETLNTEGLSPIIYRYWLLTAHYRSPVNFSTDAVKAAGNAFIRLLSLLTKYPAGGQVSSTYKEQFEKHISNDFDTPQAIALVWEMIKDKSVSDADKRATIMDFDNVLGLNLAQEIANSNAEIKISVSSKLKSPENSAENAAEITALIAERKVARAEKDWKKADEIRDKLTALGQKIID